MSDSIYLNVAFFKDFLELHKSWHKINWTSSGVIILIRITEEESSPGAEKTGLPVRVPRADDETFHAFFAPVLQAQDKGNDGGLDLDLDAIDSGSRQL